MRGREDNPKIDLFTSINQKAKKFIRLIHGQSFLFIHVDIVETKLYNCDCVHDSTFETKSNYGNFEFGFGNDICN